MIVTKNHVPTRRLKNFLQRLASYFRAALDPKLTRRLRIVQASKGLATLGAIGFALFAAYAVVLIPFTPSIANIRKAKIDQPSVLASADGKLLATFKPMNRQWMPLDRMAPQVIDALIATEDHRFYNHYGVDLVRTVSGALPVFTGNAQGGSTLTQQLARNLFPESVGHQRTITRKIKETITALKIEYAYSKKEILETYLNTMPFLYNAFGIEMAARTYFDKPAQKLTLIESATLIAMLKGTAYYNPVLNPERALQRRNIVLSQMVKRGLLSEAEFQQQKLRPIRLDFERQQEEIGPTPHLAVQIRKWLIDWADRNDKNIYADGLVVHTTIDSRLQALANQAVSRQMAALQAVADVEWAMNSNQVFSVDSNAYLEQRRQVQPFGYFWRTQTALLDSFIRESPAYQRALQSGATPADALANLKSDKEFMLKLRADKTRLQAAFVAIDPATGHVKAWVGSRDFKTDQFDHVSQAQRQPGSTFKPFVYAAALEQGMSPDKLFVDRAVEIALPDGGVWRPSDLAPPSGQAMKAREGLVYSKNTITAQVMQEVGARKTAQLARSMGINHSKLDEVPALALGTSPVTPLELVTAYSTLAAGGQYRQAIFVTRITDKDGQVLANFSSETKRVLSDRSAGHLINILRDAVDRGTGQGLRARFGVRADVAGKTGTTQKNADGWFVLMHPRLVAGSWVGFNDPRVAMRSNYWGEGAHNALLLVGDFFQHSLNAQLIDSAARFPYDQPGESFWGSLIDAAKEWFGSWFKDAPSREKIAPPPRGQLTDPQEQQRLERQAQKEQLLEKLRQKREQSERQQTDKEIYRGD